jgi:hypothetical protein
MSAKSLTTRLVASALHRTRLVGPMSAAASWLRQAGFPILTFHRVNDNDDPFMPALPTAVFSARMEHIARHYVVLTVEDLVERLQQRRLPRKALALTFDDGYRDNLTHAAPILTRYGLRATIFLTTGYIGTRQSQVRSVGVGSEDARCPRSGWRRSSSSSDQGPTASGAGRRACSSQAAPGRGACGVDRLLSQLDAGPGDAPKRLMTWEEVDACAASVLH